MRTFTVVSPVGFWTVTTDDAQVWAVDFQGKLTPISRSPQTELECQIEALFDRYFAGESVDFSVLPVHYPKPAEHLTTRVMARLREIPAGEIHSYQWLAEQLGMPQAPRAIGTALGQNPIPIIIPCHRIVAKHGRLGGFMRGCAEGPRIKTFLLELEGHHFENERLIQPVAERVLVSVS